MWDKVKKYIPGLIFCLIICIVPVYFGLRKGSRLNANHQFTTGRVYDCENVGGKQGGGKTRLKFTFVVNGEKYNASSLYEDAEISYYNGIDFFVGKTFPIAYYPPDPPNASIMITPSNFAHWGCSFPDSLNWILQYLPKEK